jgi:hypothetical protein
MTNAPERMKANCPSGVTGYYQRERPLVCEFGSDSLPSYCEFWPEGELQRYNDEYEVPIFAPGCFAFASDGGGEIYAVSEAGAVVRLPCIGMASDVAVLVAPTWDDFERSLRPAM